MPLAIEEISNSIVARVVNKENVQNIIDSNNFDLIGVPNNKYLMYLGKNEWVTIAEKVEFEKIEQNHKPIDLTNKHYDQLDKLMKITGFFDVSHNSFYPGVINSNFRIIKENGIVKIILFDTDALTFISCDKDCYNDPTDYDEILKDIQNSELLSYFFNTPKNNAIFSEINNQYLNEIKNRKYKIQLVDESLRNSNMNQIFKKYYTLATTKKNLKV